MASADPVVLGTSQHQPHPVRREAAADADKMQALTQRECRRTGQAPPPYRLLELIGKGSSGRVYKARQRGGNGRLVAVKMVDIERGDGRRPGAVDTLAEVWREISTLRTVSAASRALRASSPPSSSSSSSGARNINSLLDAFPVSHSVWMVTEYCAGGSVATLMKPTGRLPERFIIPILREVAEAVGWIHSQGIIHRDIKGANVLVTEAGAVQLCDFGIAAVVRSKVEKRSTVTGTLHWMAPELFASAPRYGAEVDIWAFGCMAYELASGWPPNATATATGARLEPDRFGDFLRTHMPRLRGEGHSEPLKDLANRCLQESARDRPDMDDILRHPYLASSRGRYPTGSLARLVRQYRDWEEGGGIRRSLCNPLVGAPPPSDPALSPSPSPSPSTAAAAVDEWNFSTEAAVAAPTHRQPAGLDANAGQDGCGHGSGVAGHESVGRRPRRPRPPAHVLAAIKAPLEKVFDPNTMTSYAHHSQRQYGGGLHRPRPTAASFVSSAGDKARADEVREGLVHVHVHVPVPVPVPVQRPQEPRIHAHVPTARAHEAPVSVTHLDAHVRHAPSSEVRPREPAIITTTSGGGRASMDNEWTFAAATEAQHDQAGQGREWPITTASAAPAVLDGTAYYSFHNNRCIDRGPGARPPSIRPAAHYHHHHHPTDPNGPPCQAKHETGASRAADRESCASLIDLDILSADPPAAAAAAASPAGQPSPRALTRPESAQRATDGWSSASSPARADDEDDLSAGGGGASGRDGRQTASSHAMSAAGRERHGTREWADDGLHWPLVPPPPSTDVRRVGAGRDETAGTAAW